MKLLGYVCPKLTTVKDVLDKCQKSRLSEQRSTANMLKGAKYS